MSDLLGHSRSSSTGVPKGVILSHKNMVSGVKSILSAAAPAIVANGPVSSDDSYIAFLPLAHVLEMLAEHVMMIMGIKIGYSSPNTLTGSNPYPLRDVESCIGFFQDRGTMIKSGDKGDATLLQPTVMATVPLILDRIYKGIKNSLKEKSLLAQRLVSFSFKYREYWSQKGYSTPIMDKLIFSNMKKIIGGKLRLMLSGGAPLADDAHLFIRTALTCKLVQVLK